MEYDLETGHGGGGDGGGRPRDGSDVGGGRNGRRPLHTNSSGGGDGGGRTARRINRRSGDGGAGAGGGWRARHINRWREQGLMITLAIHSVYLAINGLLYMLIQIKYQNQSSSPFETQMAMTSSLVALCVYFCAATLQIILVQTNNELGRLVKHVLVSSGILSPLSNILVMFFQNTVGWIVVGLFVFATTILLAYDVVKLISNCISVRNNSNNDNATPTSASVALEMSTGINYNAATTSSESLEISIENSNETSRNNNDAVEMRTGNNFTGSTHTPFHSFPNQGFGD